MSGFEIATIVLAVITAILAVSWGTMLTNVKGIWGNLQELRRDYNTAMEDGSISDKEKKEIADDVIEIITNATSVWQMIQNLIFSVGKVVKRKIIPAVR